MLDISYFLRRFNKWINQAKLPPIGRSAMHNNRNTLNRISSFNRFESLKIKWNILSCVLILVIPPLPSTFTVYFTVYCDNQLFLTLTYQLIFHIRKFFLHLTCDLNLLNMDEF